MFEHLPMQHPSRRRAVTGTATVNTPSQRGVPLSGQAGKPTHRTTAQSSAQVRGPNTALHPVAPGGRVAPSPLPLVKERLVPCIQSSSYIQPLEGDRQAGVAPRGNESDTPEKVFVKTLLPLFHQTTALYALSEMCRGGKQQRSGGKKRAGPAKPSGPKPPSHLIASPSAPDRRVGENVDSLSVETPDRRPLP